MAFIIPATASDDSFDVVVSDNSIPTIDGMETIREINGGTVFKVYYDGDISPEMKSAVEHACKIVEESLMPSLPITVSVSTRNLGSSSSGVKISQVLSRSLPDFYNGWSADLALAPQVKAIILGEASVITPHSYIDCIKDESFFDDPYITDINLIYNSSALPQCSFSIDNPPTDKYDFVSVVVRDLLRGLGYYTRFKANVSAKTIPNINDTDLTHFEDNMIYALGSKDPSQAYVNATSGDLTMQVDGEKTLSIYARSPWKQGVSLNSFIPGNDFKISHTLTYNFGKGTVTRDISDPFNPFLQRELLNWKPSITSSSTASSLETVGSTGNLITYKEDIEITDKQNIIGDLNLSEDYPQSTVNPQWDQNAEKYMVIYEYCKPYLPFNHDGYDALTGSRPFDIGWAVSILKKDGTWDCVYYCGSQDNYLRVGFDDLEFHCGDSEYARSCDGHLRVRITRSYPSTAIMGTPHPDYKSFFYVMDYLPQEVELGLSTIHGNSAQAAAAGSVTTTLGMKNLEGITRLVLEIKPQGARVPNKVEVEDFRSGVAQITVSEGKLTTVTPVAYNNNGVTRGTPLTIDLR